MLRSSTDIHRRILDTLSINNTCSCLRTFVRMLTKTGGAILHADSQCRSNRCGIIVACGFALDNHYLRSLVKVLKKDGTAGNADVYKKSGASTAWVGQSPYRLDAGRNDGCPVLAIAPDCIRDE